jgi:hypothetical protein
MPNRTEARPAKAVLTYATGRLPLLRLFSTPLVDPAVKTFYKKQLIAPWVRSLVPETCRCTAVFASLVEDRVR